MRKACETEAATGELYDAFTLVKRPSGKNELIEQAPETPEALPAANSDVAEKQKAAAH